MADKLTPKQALFVKEYMVDLNATQAAIRAGYSKKTADVIGNQNLGKLNVSQAIKAAMSKREDKAIATADEVLRYLTAAIRGEVIEECVAVENIGNFRSEARIIEKQISPKDRNKAADLMARRYGLLTDNVNVTGAIEVKVVDDIPDD